MLLLLASAATWFAPGLYVAEAALAIALALVGRDIWRAGVVDRRALTLVAVSLPSIVLVGMFSTGGFEWTTVASIVAFAAAGTGFAWLGHGLWRERAEPDGAPTALA